MNGKALVSSAGLHEANFARLLILPTGPLLCLVTMPVTMCICLFAMAALLWMLAFKYEDYGSADIFSAFIFVKYE